MMEDVSDEVILEDLREKTGTIEKTIKEIKAEMKRDEENRAECWAELRKRFNDNFIKKGDEKGWGKYLSRIPEASLSLTEEKPHSLSRCYFAHAWFAECTHPKNRKTLENLAREGFLSLVLRLREVLAEIYDFENYNHPQESFEDLSKNIGEPTEDFPLLTFIFAYYPEVLFHPSKEIVDSLDFTSRLNGLDPETRSFLEDLDKLVKYIDAFSVYQPFLFYSNKWYRDHLLHSIRVMWMMEKIIRDKGWRRIYQESSVYRLKKLLEGKNYKNEIYFPDLYWRDNVGGRLENECLRNSLAAGFFHDLMYPVSSLFKKKKIEPSTSEMNTEIEKLGRVVVPFFENRFLERDLMETVRQFFENKLIERMNVTNAMDLSRDEARKEIEQLNDCYTNQKSKNEYVEKFLKNSFDHGVLGGIWLKALPLESRQAIALHNIENVKIDPMEAPIAFFLVLCDEAQEWGRQVKTDKNGEKFLVPCEKIQWEVNNKKFRFRMSFERKKEEIKKRKRGFCVKNFFDDKFESLSRLIVPEGFEIEFSVLDLEGKERKISGLPSGWVKRMH